MCAPAAPAAPTPAALCPARPPPAPACAPRLQVQPLHVAVVLGDVAAIGALADAGASLNAQNALGMSPLQLAIVRNQLGAVEALKSRGASMKPAHIVSGTIAGSADASNGAALGGAGVSLEDIALVKASWAFVSGALPLLPAFPLSVQPTGGAG